MLVTLKSTLPVYFFFLNSGCHIPPYHHTPPQQSTSTDSYERRQPAGGRQSNGLIWTQEGKDPVEKSRGEMRAKNQLAKSLDTTFKSTFKSKFP